MFENLFFKVMARQENKKKQKLQINEKKKEGKIKQRKKKVHKYKVGKIIK